MAVGVERFVELVISRLRGHAEFKLLSRALLEKSVARGDARNSDSPDEAADWLEAEDQAKRRIPRRGILVLVSVMLTVLLFAWMFPYLSAAKFTWNSFRPGSLADPDPYADLSSFFAGLTPDERFELAGDRAPAETFEQMRILRAGAPGNPVFFSAYVTEHLATRGKLPEDFAGTAARVDPDNGWFPALQASVAAERFTGDYFDAYTRRRQPVADLPARETDEIIALIRQAARAPRFESYRGSMVDHRWGRIPPARTVADRVGADSFIARPKIPVILMRGMCLVVEAETRELARAGDAEKFKTLAVDWLALCDRYGARRDARDETYQCRFIAGAAKLRLLGVFQATAAGLGLPEEAARFLALEGGIDLAALKDRADRQFYRSQEPGVRMASFQDLSQGRLISPGRKIRDGEAWPERDSLMPGMLAVRAMTSALMCPAGAAAFGVVLMGTALFRFRFSPLVRGLSGRLADLMRPRDWVWIIAGGLVPPLLYHAVVSRLSVGHAVDVTHLTVPPMRLFVTVGVMLLAPVIIARWRLNRRAGAAGLASAPDIFGMLGVAAGLIALPALGMSWASFGGIIRLGEPEGMFVFLLSLIPCFAWLSYVVAAVAGRTEGALRRATLLRIMVPAYAAGMPLMMALAMPYPLEERQWVHRGDLPRLKPYGLPAANEEYDLLEIYQSWHWLAGKER